MTMLQTVNQIRKTLICAQKLKIPVFEVLMSRHNYTYKLTKFQNENSYRNPLHRTAHKLRKRPNRSVHRKTTKKVVLRSVGSSVNK